MKLEKLNDFFQEFYVEKNSDEKIIDLHLHTNFSDGFINCRALEKHLQDKSYLIAVTDHNSIGGNLLLRKMGINVIPGIELGCADGFEMLVYFKTEDDLIYFYKSYIEPNKNKYRMSKTHKDINYYLSALENFTCYKSIPHIAGMAQKNFIKNKDYIYNVIGRVDAIEIHNNALPEYRNKIAKSLQEKYNKEITFGSDAHFMEELISFSKIINHLEKESLFENYSTKLRLITWLGKKHLSYGIKALLEK
ncbi:PHP domain-containing protein [Fusobacterium sp.]|uniref:PHP domain-containing protein n=1 Tax=Fusobacterium sp. TaxID=68766 RepID=UPI00261EE081|nr:PHP domain-containing protein [Fusobacterium sp.]